MKNALLLFPILATMLCSSPAATPSDASPATKEAHYLASITKEYREAALVVVADITSDAHNVIIDPREVWKAAPGYSAARILIPKSADQAEHPGTYVSSGGRKSLVYFCLKGTVSQWGGFTIKNERVLVAPQYSLAELRKMLNEGLNQSLTQDGNPDAKALADVKA